MDYYVEQVKYAIEVTRITSQWGYSWFGKPSQKLSQKARTELTGDKARSYLVFALQSRLYNDFYCPGMARATDEPIATPSSFGQMDFVEELSRANQGSGPWEPGWTSMPSTGGTSVVARDGLRLKVEPTGARSSYDEAFEAGAIVRIRFPKECRGVSPGFYMALGDRPLAENMDVLRVYFNILAMAAPSFMNKVTDKLNSADIGFKLKIVNDDTRFDRCDSAVLYICKCDFEIVSPVLWDVCADFASALGERTPVFTKVLVPGVGLAESPPAKGPQEIESFGMNRCRLVSEGLVEAYERRVHDLTGRLRIVEECFRREGVSLAVPYLNPNSADEYDSFYRSSTPPAAHPSSAPMGRPPHFATNQFLETAVDIGRHLTESAVWHEDRCTWIGAQPPEFETRREGTGSTYAALGPDVYSGVAGIALFLAEVSRITVDPEISRTAVGAARQSARLAERIPATNRVGLYTGWVGIALSLVRVGTLTNTAEIRDLGQNLALQVPGLPREECEADFLSGRAGAIVGLIALSRMLGNKGFLEYAQLLGGELVESAKHTGGKCSWGLRAYPRRPNLTGFSHGTAGIAHGLLELFDVTREIQWLECAASAFAYEEAVFDPRAGNWPDFRNAQNGHRGPHWRSFATYWCHGAPGIALSRILASQIAPEKKRQEEIAIALKTTRSSIESGLQKGKTTFSLCHGLAGNADVVLQASVQGMGEAGETLHYEVGLFGKDEYSAHRSWPCGVGRGLNQSLMLGLAGIGYFYLRLHDPNIPSVLTFHFE